MKILSNKAKCLKCGDVIESKHVHDYVNCKCGAISVDGGTEYLKRSGSFSDIEDLSEYELEATDLEEMKSEQKDEKGTDENEEQISGELEMIRENGDPLGIPVRVYRAGNGFICVDSDPEAFSPTAVFETKDGQAESESLSDPLKARLEFENDVRILKSIRDLLWHLKDILSVESEGKYSRDRIQITTEMGEKYIPKEGERIVETRFWRVGGAGEENGFCERTVTKKELEEDE